MSMMTATPTERRTPHTATSLSLLLAFVLLAVNAAAEVAIRVDCGEAPDLQEWAEKVRQDGVRMYPVFTNLFRSAGYTPPQALRIVFKARDRGVAATGGTNISVSANWVRQHPDDYGCVIHEIAHVVQSYPRYDPTWLVESLADYARFWKYEPVERRPRPRPEHIQPHATYQAGAAFLGWLAERFGEELVTKLSAAVRERRYRDELFVELTGQSLDDLTAAFRAAVAANRKR